MMPETALLQAKATVLQREADVLAARNALEDTRSRLKDLLNFAPGGNPPIVPLDQPSADARSIDIEQAVKDALAKRPELPQVRFDLKNKDVVLGYAKNQVLPQLNLFGSYGLMGLAGNQHVCCRRADGDGRGQQYLSSPSSVSEGDYGPPWEPLLG
jgi:outer membrane protein TolC